MKKLNLLLMTIVMAIAFIFTSCEDNGDDYQYKMNQKIVGTWQYEGITVDVEAASENATAKEAAITLIKNELEEKGNSSTIKFLESSAYAFSTGEVGTFELSDTPSGTLTFSYTDDDTDVVKSEQYISYLEANTFYLSIWMTSKYKDGIDIGRDKVKIEKVIVKRNYKRLL